MMRPVSDAWRTLIGYSHPMVCRIESWLGSDLLAEDVPIITGRIDWDDSGTIKRRLTFEVPARTGERSWDPVDDAMAPLAVYGQRLHVLAGIAYPNGTTEMVSCGWFLVTKWSHEEADATISVEAQGLAQLLVDDRLTEPSSPPAGTSFAAEFTRLIDGIMPTRIDLADRAITDTTVVWDRDRDKALDDLCGAWPARWYIDDDGVAVAAPPYAAVNDDTPPDVVLTDGAAGTLVARQRGGERGTLFNIAVVDGKANDDGSAGPHAVAMITSPASPIRVGGPYGRVPQFYASDLITTQAQAQATAAANLVTYATAGRSEPVQVVPDPSLQLGDVARLFTKDGWMCTGRIIAITLPLTPGEAPMAVTCACLPGGVIDETTTMPRGEV